MQLEFRYCQAWKSANDCHDAVDEKAPVSFLASKSILNHGDAALFSVAACRAFKKRKSGIIVEATLVKDLTKELRIFRPLVNNQEKEFLNPVLCAKVYKTLWGGK